MTSTDSRAVAPYGSWPSPISASLVATGARRWDELHVDGASLYWLESRPQEGGRVALMRLEGEERGDERQPEEVTPAPWSVRTRVHEYGGGAYLVEDGVVFFSNFSDQRLWRLDPGATTPVALTAPADERQPETLSVRFADACLVPGGHWLVCVRESHHGPAATQVVNEVVALPTEEGSDEESVLATGRDFYSFPRVSPDGRRLAWTSWDHPRMPWDGSELWVADLDGPVASNARVVAGGPEESVFQPQWAPDGSLTYVSDRDRGWWNLYLDTLDGARPRALTSIEGELGLPQWVFGLSTYAHLPDGRIACSWLQGGMGHLGLLDPSASGAPLTELSIPHSSVSHVRATPRGVAYLGAGPRIPREVVELPLSGGEPGPARTLARSRHLDLDLSGLAQPDPIEYPTTGGRSAHALYYRPASASHRGPEDQRPPLVVMSHGGPTAATSSAFDLAVQYWTSRGIAVVDVNYGGSTGYGREYRQRLQGTWGIVDVDDCVNAALYLADRGQVDGGRLAIRGGSAGGYTTLCALTFRDVFAAGASYYGVADAAALAADTHKFESRYLDGLIGPWPEAERTYWERSPVHHADQLSCPLIILQGLEDPVVPPNQAEAMVAALRERGMPHAYLAFEGEQHGFRRAETVQRCLEAELSFYGAILGFDVVDPIDPVPIEPPPPRRA
jgi:dipeptidyl aminopeptidase/acylaminoacyl peptidase